MIIRTSTLALLLLTTAASASDLPLAGVVETTAAADAWPWSGCYIGASLGYAAQTIDIPLAAGLYDGGSHLAEGATLGLRAGCDTQIDNLVLGLVGTVEITDSSGSNAFFPVGPASPSTSPPRRRPMAASRGGSATSSTRPCCSTARPVSPSSTTATPTMTTAPPSLVKRKARGWA